MAEAAQVMNPGLFEVFGANVSLHQRKILVAGERVQAGIYQGLGFPVDELAPKTRRALAVLRVQSQ